jgi:aminopeptidase N
MSNLVSVKEEHPHLVYRKDYELPSHWVEQVMLDIQLNEDHTLVTSRIQFRPNSDHPDQHTLMLYGEALILESIKLNQMDLAATQYSVTDKALTIRELPNVPFELEIVTRIFPNRNTALSGLYYVRGTYCTQCEAEGFRRITYFLDRPDVLAFYTTKITADRTRYPVLLSNGNPIEAGELPDGRHWATWQDPYRKPSYLFAMVAGQFDLLEDQFITQSGRKVALRVYVDRGFRDQAHHAMASLKAAMRWDEEAYGREYDLDIYMIVAMGDFNMGAMENKGLNVFNTKYVLARPDTATDEDYVHVASVIAHEYCHNWSGNRVTCRDWFQLSLKEGLTIFRDQSFSEDTVSHAVMRIRNVSYLRDAQFPEDAGPLAHPVRPDAYIEIDNFYTTTIYEKGAEVIRMMQTILGKPLFRQAMDRYFTQFDGQAVTIEDFVANMEKVSGIDLAQFRLWYAQAGTPEVTAESHYDAANQRYRLTFHQKTNSTPGEPHKKPLHIPIRMGLLNYDANPIPLAVGGKESAEQVLSFTQETQTFTFENIPTPPIPSLFRHFSAPVKFDYPYSEEELVFLYRHDTDPFNRREAGQRYLMQVLLRMIDQAKNRKTLQLPATVCDLFDEVLKSNEPDLLFTVEMLSLPTFRYIAEHMPVIDVEAIHVAREFALSCIAKSLEPLLLDTYHQYRDGAKTTQFDVQQMGRRKLKNHCLGYLMLLPAHAEMGMQQFKQALKANMTDTQAALSALSHLDSPLRSEALQQFYQAFQNDPLVVDKWFAIQAGSKRSDTLQTVKALMRHAAFNIKNPNNVYALIGTFSQQNKVRFHVVGGEGYVFLRECVAELDKLNPQIAARMVKPLTEFRRYDKERQILMKQQLTILLDQQPSTDVYELLTKSLH